MVIDASGDVDADRCHTDDKFFDTEKLFKISLKLFVY